MISPDFHEEAGLLTLSGAERRLSRARGIPLRCIVALLCSVITLQGQLRPSWPDKGKATKGSNPSGTKV